jgi:hypothetical protein
LNSRWWENYFVRYLVGTVFGALLLQLLIAGQLLPYHEILVDLLAARGELKNDAFLGVGLAAALGFAFCYIASAPVLTAHAFRAHFLRPALTDEPIRHVVVAFVVVAGTVYVAIFKLHLPVHAAALLGVIFGLQFSAVVLAALNRFQHVAEFYRVLAERRGAVFPKEGDKPTAGSEYITSYRHLREHGNAFSIVLMEGALAYLLCAMPSATSAIVLLVVWVVPAAFVWFVGTILESRLTGRSTGWGAS